MPLVAGPRIHNINRMREREEEDVETTRDMEGEDEVVKAETVLKKGENVHLVKKFLPIPRLD